uniref:Uncharacterized protein n=1 Tax=Cacopsylla melanoneura TaxID=428564 RepID=A0A8D8QEB1_9HEMI
MYGKPAPNGNEYPQNPNEPDGNFEPPKGTFQNPEGPQTGNIPTRGNVYQTNNNKWRPIKDGNTDQGIQSPDQNWKPNTVNENPNGQNVWKPSNNIPQNGENTKIPQAEHNGYEDENIMKTPPNTWKPRPQNTWRPNSEKGTLWRPNNLETIGPHWNTRPPQSSLWIPHNGNINGNPLFEERPQNGNESDSLQMPPQTQNNNKHNEEFENKRPHDGWKPNNVDLQEPEKDHKWRPQTRPDSDGWRPEDVKNSKPLNQPPWNPQNTKNSNPDENSWIPHNGDNQQGCNEWTPEGLNYPSDSKGQWKPSGTNHQYIGDCNQNQWVPKNKDPENNNRVPEIDSRDPENYNGDPENDNRATENYNRDSINDNRDPENYNRDPENTNGGNQNLWISTKEGADEYKTQEEKLRNNPNTNTRHSFNTDENEQTFNRNRPREENEESKRFHKTRTFDRTIGENRVQQRGSRERATFSDQDEVLRMTRQRLRNSFNKQERLTMESKKSYKKTKPPVNKESLNGAEQNITMQLNANMNRTKDEPKQEPVTVRIRDPDTRKCRAVTYKPNEEPVTVRIRDPDTRKWRAVTYKPN